MGPILAGSYHARSLWGSSGVQRRIRLPGVINLTSTSLALSGTIKLAISSIPASPAPWALPSLASSGELCANLLSWRTLTRGSDTSLSSIRCRLMKLAFRPCRMVAVIPRASHKATRPYISSRSPDSVLASITTISAIFPRSTRD